MRSATLTSKIWRHLKKQLTADCRCELCMGSLDEQHRVFLCSSCHRELPNPPPSCSQCSEPLLFVEQEGRNQRCKKCQLQPPDYDYSHYRFLFQPPIDLWIRAAKDKHQEHWLTRLSMLMLESPPPALSSVDGLVYVPSHWWTRLKRGYNPAAVLARRISQQTQTPIYHQALTKSWSRDQRHLGVRERRQNLSQTLRAGKAQFHGEHLLIIDDVMTTGSTAAAAARILKQRGAGIVGVWALARTPPRSFLRHNAR